MGENVSVLMRAARSLRDRRTLSWAIALLSIVAGLGYILFSPVTTTNHFDGAWPAVLWGAAMLVGGVLKCHGLSTKVLDWQLLNPQTVDPSLLAMVASRSPVAEAITVVEGVVDTSGVADQDIIDAVKASWPIVAHKYTVNPLAGG